MASAPCARTGSDPADASFFIRQHGNNISLFAGEWLDVDVWAFDDHCARARDADPLGLPSSDSNTPSAPSSCGADEPVELASEPWAIAPVEERGLRFATTAVRAGELLLAQGDLDRVQDLADRALAIDPWLEAGHRLIIATHRARGDNLAARRALQRYRDAVHDLGVDTSEATMMVERLLERARDGRRPGHHDHAAPVICVRIAGTSSQRP